MSRRSERDRAPVSLTVTVDPAKQSLSEVLKVTAGLAPLAMVTARMLVELVDELGGQEEAGRFLCGIAEQIGRPVGLNLPAPDGGSRSMFLAPRGWTREKLAGWVAAKRDELQAAFGPAVPVMGENERAAMGVHDLDHHEHEDWSLDPSGE